jgi:trehalose/maltose transport system permease protein
MTTTTYASALRAPLGFTLLTWSFLVVWLIVAAFPLLWIVVMSVKLPIDALASNPITVITGPATRAEVGGPSVSDLTITIALLYFGIRLIASRTGALALRLSPVRGLDGGAGPLGWLAAALVVTLASVITVAGLLPPLLAAVRAILGAVPVLDLLAQPVLGMTLRHYHAVWIDLSFYRNFLNSMLVTAGVVTISLSVGTLAGYALSRTGSGVAFWLLLIALIFRALPHSVLVTGYLPPFLNSHEILQPLWEMPVLGAVLGMFATDAPTLYGQPLAIILVLVAINQPFTIWMLRSFFTTVPTELDEAAKVDGCSDFQAFRQVIMPVMWPGVITTGLFSFLLAYNDYLVCALLLDGSSQTMVPAITQFFNRETTSTDQIQAVAAAVSITAPLFVLVMVFQRQIVSGLTAGAVKG